jgi:hypothetical protein
MVILARKFEILRLKTASNEPVSGNLSSSDHGFGL